jgi:hypothetical protein
MQPLHFKIRLEKLMDKLANRTFVTQPNQQFQFLLLFWCQLKFGSDRDLSLALGLGFERILDHKVSQELAHPEFLVDAVFLNFLMLIFCHVNIEEVAAWAFGPRSQGTAAVRSHSLFFAWCSHLLFKTAKIQPNYG